MKSDNLMLLGLALLGLTALTYRKEIVPVIEENPISDIDFPETEVPSNYPPTGGVRTGGGGRHGYIDNENNVTIIGW